MTQIDDEKEEPLDPAVEHIRQRMMRMLKINGIIMLGLMAVLAAIVYKINNRKDADTASAERSVIPGDEVVSKKSKKPLLLEVDVDIPDNARIISSDIKRNRLVLELALPDNLRQIWLVDLTDGEVKSRISIR